MDSSPTVVPSRRLALEALVAAVAARSDPCAVVLVTGASGCGSSAFAARFAELCGPGEQLDVARVRRLTGLPWLHGDDGAALRGLIGEPETRPADAAQQLIDTVERTEHRWDCAVVVTDAHLVDRLTVETLLTATRLSEQSRLLVVLDWTEPLHPGAPLSAHRHEDPALDNFYDDARAAADHVADLAPLTVDDVAALAEQLGVAVPTVEIPHLVRHTGGNARSVVELLREVAPSDWQTPHLALPAPASVRRAVREVVTALPQLAVRLMDAIAALEEADPRAGSVGLHTAFEVAGVDRSRATVGALLHSGLVVRLDGRGTVLRLRDVLTRRAILDEADPATLALLHARAAEVIGDGTARLRHRWFACDLPDDELAERLTARAGEEAASGAWASAGELLELVNPRRDPDTAAVIAQRHVLHSLANCQAGQLVSWADRAIELAAPDTPAAIEAAAIRGLARAVLDSPDAALDGYSNLLAAHPEGAVAARIRMASGWLDLAADHPQQARDELERAVPTDHLGGSLRISLWARAWLARTQFLTGDWSAALQTATIGAALADGSGMALLAPLLHWTRAQVYTLRGDWPMAQRCLQLGAAGQHDYPIMRVPAALGRAALHEARADYPAVVRTLVTLTEPWAQEWVASPGFWPWADVYANALVVTGELDEADRFLQPQEEHAAAVGHSSTLARLGYARGRWHGQAGDLEAARRCFSESIDLISRLPYPYDLARIHFAFGQTLRRAGRRAEADAELSAAREHFAHLGAASYVTRCDRELAAGGVHAPRATAAYSDVLTAQESAVAALVAQGRTNKDVAAELFLSVKTVQYHLTRVYAKLGVRSRSQLAARWPADGTTSLDG